MELRHLEAFVEAAHRGSISLAAKSLYLTQPSLTQRVHALEQEVGQQLLVRSRQGVRLTPAGSLLLPRAEAALAALRQGAEEVKELRAMEAGRLSLAVTSDVAIYLLPTPLARFQQAHPAVEIALHTGRSLPMAALILSGGAELALVDAPMRLPEMHVECLYEEPLLPVAAPGHPLAEQSRVAVPSFAAAGLAAYESGSPLHDVTTAYFEAAGVAPLVTLRADSAEAVRRMVAAGIGVGLLPELCVRDDVVEGRLVILSLARPALPTRGIWACRRESAQPTTIVRAFLDLVAGALPHPVLAKTRTKNRQGAKNATEYR